MKEGDLQRVQLTELLKILFATLVSSLPETKYELDHKKDGIIKLSVTGIHSPEIVFAIMNASIEAQTATPLTHRVNLMIQPPISSVELSIPIQNQKIIV